jgi:hypothetical protein
MAAQSRLVKTITVTTSKAEIGFGTKFVEYLYAPFHLVRQERAGDDQWAVIIANRGSVRGYLVNADAVDGLAALPRVEPGDPLLTDPKVESVLHSLQTPEAPVPTAGTPLSAAPSAGTISSDGAFLTIDIDGRRNHFVVNRDPLPIVIGAPIRAPDGSHAVSLRLPDRTVTTFRVPPEQAIEMEKAVALMRSFEPAAPRASAPTTQRYHVQPRSSAPQAPVVTRDHPNGTAILVLGILGLVTCGLLAVVAWVMGNSALREMDSQRNVVWSNRSNVTLGRVCGIIGTCMLVVILLAWVILAAAAQG